MRVTPQHLLNVKEGILVFTVLYFMGLAMALQFGASTFGLTHPAIFLPMLGLYLFALGLEVVLAWWNKRSLIVWLVLWAASYSVIGLFLAPQIFGQGVYPYTIALPLVIVFIGGFAFSCGKVLSDFFTFRPDLRPAELRAALEKMPGWNAKGAGLEKSYTYRGFDEALNFVNAMARLGKEFDRLPEFHIEKKKRVSVRIMTPGRKRPTRGDLRLAKAIDEVS